MPLERKYLKFQKHLQNQNFQISKIVNPLTHPRTSTKNPNYNDTHYVENLPMKNTINTMPEATLDSVEKILSIKKSTSSNDAQYNIQLLEKINIVSLETLLLFFTSIFLTTSELALKVNKMIQKIIEINLNIVKRSYT